MKELQIHPVDSRPLVSNEKIVIQQPVIGRIPADSREKNHALAFITISEDGVPFPVVMFCCRLQKYILQWLGKQVEEYICFPARLNQAFPISAGQMVRIFLVDGYGFFQLADRFVKLSLAQKLLPGSEMLTYRCWINV